MTAKAVNGTLQNAATGTGVGIALGVLGMGRVVYTITGTFVGTITFQGTEDGTDYTNLQATQLGTTTTAATATAPGQYQADCGGLQKVIANITGYTSGSITVTAHAVPGGGGGSGGAGGGVSGGVPQSTSDILTSVPASASSRVLLAANAARVGVKITNDSSATLYIACAATASTSLYTAKLLPGEPWEMPPPISPGIISGIWDSATGNAVITESSGQTVAATVSLTGSVTIAASGVSAGALVDGADVTQGLTTDAAVTTDANGTLSAKLRGMVKILGDAWDSTNHRLNTAIASALPAGTNIIGRVGIDQTTPGTTNAVSANQGTAGSTPWPVSGPMVLISTSFTRPANTTAYAAGQVVANATSVATVPSFASAARVAAGSGYVLRAKLVDGNNAGTPAGYTLYLYSASPVNTGNSATGPNDAQALGMTTADAQNLIAAISYTSNYLVNGAAGAAGYRVYEAEGLTIPFVLAAGTTIYGLVVVGAAYTPVSAESIYLELTIAQN